MTKIKCKLTGKEFCIELGMRTVIKCPKCKIPFRVSYGNIGLGFDVGINIEDGSFHEIIYNKTT